MQTKQSVQLKLLLGFDASVEDSAMDAGVDFALQNAKEIVKNYCNLGSIPAGLNTTVLRMAMDIYRNENCGSGEARAVKSLAMGDTKTEFASTQSESFEASLLKNYAKQLSRYRKVSFR